MKDLKLLDAGPEGSVLYEMKITERYSNLNGMQQPFHEALEPRE